MPKELVPVFLLTFVNMLGFSVLFPVYPFILEKYQQSSLLFGFLVAAYSFFQFFAAPLLGALSDKYGRRPLLLLSQTGTLLSWVIFAIAYFLPDTKYFGAALPIIVIILSRIVDGITGGNISVANASLIDLTKPKERTKFFGINGAILGIAVVIGPVIGGFSSGSGLGYLGTVIIAFIISLITLILMYFFLPESLPENKRDKELEIMFLKDINIIAKIKRLKNPLLSKLFGNRIFFTMTFSAYTSILTLFAKDRYLLDAKTLGIVFLVIGFYLIINQGLFVNKFSQKFGELKLYYVGQVFFVLGQIGIVFAANLPLFLIATYINNLGISLAIPTFKSVLSDIADDKKQGAITGIDESLFALSSAIAPIISGILYNFLSFKVPGIYATIVLVPFVLNYLRTRNFTISY